MRGTAFVPELARNNGHAHSHKADSPCRGTDFFSTPADNTLLLLFDIYSKHDNNLNNFEPTYLQGKHLLRYNKV